MISEEEVLVVTVSEGQDNGNWSIKAFIDDECVASTGTFLYDAPRLSEKEKLQLASLLVHTADEWMEGR